jgi:type VI protein secretion system component Hcp
MVVGKRGSRMPGYLYVQPIEGNGAAFLGSVSPDVSPPIKGGASSPGYVDEIRLTGVQFGLDVGVERLTLEEARQRDAEDPPSWMPAEFLRPDTTHNQKYWLDGAVPAMGPVVVTKRTDRSSVALLEAASRSIKLFGRITLTSVDKDSEDAYLAIYLWGVLVAKTEATWQDDGKRPLERWVLYYERIQWSFQWTPSAEQLWFGWDVLTDEAATSSFGSLDWPQR